MNLTVLLKKEKKKRQISFSFWFLFWILFHLMCFRCSIVVNKSLGIVRGSNVNRNTKKLKCIKLCEESRLNKN